MFIDVRRVVHVDTIRSLGRQCNVQGELFFKIVVVTANRPLHVARAIALGRRDQPAEECGGLVWDRELRGALGLWSSGLVAGGTESRLLPEAIKPRVVGKWLGAIGASRAHHLAMPRITEGWPGFMVSLVQIPI